MCVYIYIFNTVKAQPVVHYQSSNYFGYYCGPLCAQQDVPCGGTPV